MSTTNITEQEFEQFQNFIYDAAGITLSSAKKALVGGRLAKRIQEYKLKSYGEYFNLLTSGTVPEETQVAVDLLTTNETYFFREMKHFDLLRELASAHRNASGGQNQAFRVWSAASSTGEEPYSIAMVLSEFLPREQWEVIASDISMRVLQKARIGHYPLERTTHIPPAYLKRYCLRGIDTQEGTLLIERSLRNHVQFTQINLNLALPKMGLFDVIFLRNVLIYFSQETKREVIARVLTLLKRDGYLFIGHSESLNGVSEAMQGIAPAIYRKS